MIRLVVLLIALVFGFFAYKTDDLNNVNQAYVYRISYALFCMAGIRFIGEFLASFV